MQKTRTYLKSRGEQLDSAIAAATRIPLADMCLYLSEWAKRCDVIACYSTRFIGGKKVEGMLCRMAGFTLAAKAGRKPKAQR